MNNPFSPSPLQLAIGDAVEARGSNLIVEAVAGSGKTTTLLYCLSRIQSTGFLPPSILFLAFNKSIADTLQERCPRGVECSTFHRLGLQALKRAGVVDAKKKNLVDSRKVPKLVWDRMDREDPDIQAVIKLVYLLKGQTDKPSIDLCHQLAGHYDLDFQDDDSLSTALEVLRWSTRSSLQPTGVTTKARKKFWTISSVVLTSFYNPKGVT